jgi:peptide/nickel transport system permease protein
MGKLGFLRLVASRLVGSAFAVFGASIIAFILLRISPGDPARLYLGEFASQEAVDALRHEMGLDDTLLTQYVTYMTDFFTGDWGFSYNTGEAVADQFAARLPATIELGLLAFLFAVAGALVLAVIGTYRRRPFVDRIAVGFAYLGMGLPPFWFALVLLIVFYQNLGWFPGPVGRLGIEELPPPEVTHFYTVDALIAGQWSTFASALWHLTLPAAALGFLSMAFLMRLLRANLLDVSRDPFLVVVRSKGVGRFTAYRRHALPNAFLPTLTYGGMVLAQLLGGSVLVEKVFNWPGIGLAVTEGIARKDFAVVQVFILLSVLSYVVINFVVDMLYGAIDPRVRERAAA